MNEKLANSDQPNGIARVAALYTWLLANTPVFACGVVALARKTPFDFGQYEPIATCIAFLGAAILIKTLRGLQLVARLPITVSGVVNIDQLKSITRHAGLASIGLILILVGTLNQSRLFIFAVALVCYAGLSIKIYKSLLSSKS